MKALLAASLLAAASVAAAQAPSASSTTPQQADALMALARVHGIVRYFHPSDAVETMKWNPFLVRAAERMGTVASASEIGPRLEEIYGPIVEGFRVVPVGTAITRPQGEGPIVEWRHLGYGIDTDAASPYVSWRTHYAPVAGGKVKGGFFQHRGEAEAPVHAEPVMRVPVAAGLEAHVPVSLPLSAAKLSDARKAKLEEFAAALDAVPMAGDEATRAQAHADGIAAWNVARHFYPYWDVVKVDWEAGLRPWLLRQPATLTRDQLRDSLRALAEPLNDAQGEIADPRQLRNRAFLGISVRPAGERWVVDASLAPDKIKPGDVVSAVGGKPANAWFKERMALISGSAQHKRWRARYELTAGDKGETIAIRFTRGKESFEATLTYDQPRAVHEARPAALQEVKPGIHYVDASRFDKAAFEKALETMKDAKGVVFDLRGLPARDAVTLASHWVTRPDSAQWMFVPRIDRPGAMSSASWSLGWNVGPNATLAKAKKVLLVDGRTVGYGESLAGYFPAHSTGPVVGAASAGATGNIAIAPLPSGLGFIFTGMRVTRHDGKTPIHGKGFEPDTVVAPTLEGIRAGRDEALDRAVEIASGR
ncbi:MAG TPA: S41 family peptidase [Usitatibacter sp.]|nr:S41 family peptidase [Usitatibacter sp.]